jgi:hypothetical protein
MPSAATFVALRLHSAVTADVASLAAVIAAVFVEVFRDLFSSVAFIEVVKPLAPLHIHA